jgi:hypothetical protein
MFHVFVLDALQNFPINGDHFNVYITDVQGIALATIISLSSNSRSENVII